MNQLRVLLVFVIGALVSQEPIFWAWAEEPCKDDLYFSVDSFALTNEARDTLRCHATALASHPDRRLRLEGHADERGTTAFSMVLGQQRARSARRFLLEELGVPADRIATTSHGKQRPACREHTPACWAQNRRVHVVVLEGSSKVQQ